MVTSKDILDRADRLRNMKAQDYSGNMWTQDDYFPYKDQSYIHMIWTKMLRIRNLVDVMHPNYESLEDSLLDMINYCAMYAAHIENEKKAGEDFDKKYTEPPTATISTVGEGTKEIQLPEPQQQRHELWQIQKNRT